MDTVGGKGGEAGTDGECRMEAYTMVCQIRQSVGICRMTQEINSELCDNPEGWERGSRGRGHMHTMADSR